MSTSDPTTTPWLFPSALWSPNLICTTAFFTLPLLLCCFSLFAWLLRTYGGTVTRFLAILRRPAIECIEITIIACSCYIMFTKYCHYALWLARTIIEGDPPQGNIELALEILMVRISSIFGYALFTAVGVYVTEAIAEHTTPKSLDNLSALRPLHGSFSCLLYALAMLSAKAHTPLPDESLDKQAMYGDGDDYEYTASSSDESTADDRELNNYEAWGGQPRSTPRSATKRAEDQSVSAKCEGRTEAECEE